MKKRCAIFIVLVMSFSLVACGVDKQSALDAHNNAYAAYDRLAEKVNADIDAYPQEIYDAIDEMSGVMQEHKDMLESGKSLTGEQVDEMVQALAEVEKWVEDTEAGLEELKYRDVDKQPALDALDKASGAYDKLVNDIIVNGGTYSEEIAEVMREISSTLNECRTVLESEQKITEADVYSFVDTLSHITDEIVKVENEMFWGEPGGN